MLKHKVCINVGTRFKMTFCGHSFSFKPTEFLNKFGCMCICMCHCVICNCTHALEEGGATGPDLETQTLVYKLQMLDVYTR